ncbi:hypothetical protein RQP46_006701 [Phenoliferia psychrophenolica]
MHLFFPSPLPTAAPLASTSRAPPSTRFLYGWTTPTALVVAGAIDAFSADEANERISDLVTTAFPLPLHDSNLAIIGTLLLNHPLNDTGKSREGSGKGGKKKGGLKVVLSSTSRGVPIIVQSSSDHQDALTTILYTPPSRSNLQFFSITPLQLDLNEFSDPRERSRVREGDAPGEDEEARVLGDKVRQAAGLDFAKAKEECGTDLARVIDWINIAPYLTSKLASKPPSRRHSLLSSFTHSLLLPTLAILNPPLRIIGLVANGLVLFANWEIPGLGGTAPKDLSATASAAPSLAAGRAHYIQFYNTLWLIANDVIVGSAFASFFCENADVIGSTLGTLIQEYTLDSLRELLLWLNDWPGGVKLNYELASVFCDAFLWGTGLWEDLIFTPLRASLPHMVYAVGLSGLLGTTMLLSAASDLLALLTLHVFVFYLLVTSLFRWHLSMLGALFNIFRGKKYNVLRHRVEPASYSVDQLLLGTILFTLAAFLFPTVLAYYLAFAAARLAIVAVHAALESVLAFMNHFPLFAVMLRFKDPKRLPGGLGFELNNPIHLAGIFFQHLQLSRRLASHYSPLYLLGRLLTGRLISPIPRVRLRLWTDVKQLRRTASSGE